MRISKVFYVAAFAALGLMGCASDVGDRGESLLRTVDEHAMTAQVLYSVSGFAIPLTAAELEEQGIDRTDATPVRVEMYNDVAVAWYAPEGVAIFGRDNIIALWTVVDRVPITDEIAPDEIVVAPSEEPFVFEGPALNTDSPLAQNTNVSIGGEIEPVTETIIDFVDQIGSSEELGILREIAANHPGCL